MIIQLIKKTLIWNSLRSLKQWLLSFSKSPEEKTLEEKNEFIVSANRVLQRKKTFFLQGRMDIDPLSYWHNSQFIEEYGGFFPKNEKCEVNRKIADITSYDLVRRDMIILLLRTLIQNNIEGEFAELGVYRGETAKLIHHYCPERSLTLFDTFEGFDKKDISFENTQIKNSESITHFKDTSEKLVLDTLQPRSENIHIKKGYFPDSLTREYDSKRFAFVHLDSDLYKPTKNGLEFFYPRMNSRGIVLVHDYNAWPGVRKAVDEFLSDKPELAIPMPDKSGSAIFVKH